jgi:hypothetical protein
MDTKQILTDLRIERQRIDRAIVALEGLDGTGTVRATASGAPPAPVKARGRRRMSAAGRKRISEMMKARWEARRKQAAKPASTKAGGRKPMSAAIRKRLSLLAKRRWAARKKAAKAA